MPEMEPYSSRMDAQFKPPMFSPFMGVMPEKKFKADVNFESYFLDQLGDIESKIGAENKDGVADIEFGSLETQKAAKEGAAIKQGMAHMGVYDLFEWEMMASPMNLEKTKDEKYEEYADTRYELLSFEENKEQISAFLDAKKKRKKQFEKKQMEKQEKISNLSNEEIRQTHFDQLTKTNEEKMQESNEEIDLTEVHDNDYGWTHNQQLTGLEENPFDPEDPNYDLYEAMKDKEEGSVNELGGLYEYKQKADELVVQVQDKIYSKKVMNPYSDVKFESKTIQGTYPTLMQTPEVWEKLTSEELFILNAKRYSGASDFIKFIREIGGEAFSYYKETDQIETIQSISFDPEDFKMNSQSLEDLIISTEEAFSQMDTKDIIKNPDPGVIHKTITLYHEITNFINLFKENQLTGEQKQKIEGLDKKREAIFAFIDIERSQKWLDSNPFKEEEKTNIAEAESWFENVGSKQRAAGNLVSQAVGITKAAEITSSLKWSSWAESIEDVSEVRKNEILFSQKTLAGALSFVAEKVKRDFMPERRVSAAHFTFDNLEYGINIFEQLKADKFIDQDGRITDKFNPDQWSEYQIMGLKPQENNFVFSRLYQASFNERDFEKVDQSLINGKKRAHIKFITPEEEHLSMKDVLSLINQGETLEEKYNNTRKAYDILFDIYENMTGLGLGKSKTKGDVVGRQVNGHFEVKVYEKAQWVEKSPTGNNSEESRKTTRKNQGILSVQFDTKESAQKYLGDIELTLDHLIPMLSGFERGELTDEINMNKHYSNGKIESVALRKKIDNQNMFKKGEIVNKSSAHYEKGVDLHLYSKEFYESEKYKETSKHINYEISFLFAKRIFGKMSTNSHLRRKHRRQVAEYKEKKAEHNEAEFNRVKEEYKKENKRKKERIEAFNKQEGRKVQQLIQEKIMEARRRREEMARRNRGGENVETKISDRVRELKSQKSKKGKK